LASSVIACAGRAPLVVRSRPRLTHGVQAGDVGGGRATIWARGSEEGWLEVEWDTTERFAAARRGARARMAASSDFAAVVALSGLPDEQLIWYRARLVREAARGESEWAVGRFATPSARSVRFAWCGDTCGQGFGINDEWGGMLGYRAMRAAAPAFYVHCGDMIYADNPIEAELPLADGKVWKNRSNARVAKVADGLDDFRARFAYNLDDAHVRALAAEVPIIATWDDHETRNNWYPGQVLDDPRYVREQRASELAGWSRRAAREWVPISGGDRGGGGGAATKFYRTIPYGPLLDVFVLDLRAFRSSNDGNRGARRAMLGAAQQRWFLEAMARSQAAWKVVVCSQPLGLVVTDGPSAQEGWANGASAGGAARGRELELAETLAELQRRSVKDALWVTADVHYSAAHHYDPARGSGTSFTPFWELVAGPINAGAFGASELDPTFGPEVKWQKAIGGGAMGAPWDGYATFGTVEVTRDGAVCKHHGVEGEWWSASVARQ
jgi:alkaline phosphatase D